MPLAGRSVDRRRIANCLEVKSVSDGGAYCSRGGPARWLIASQHRTAIEKSNRAWPVKGISTSAAGLAMLAVFIGIAPGAAPAAAPTSLLHAGELWQHARRGVYQLWDESDFGRLRWRAARSREPGRYTLGWTAAGADSVRNSAASFFDFSVPPAFMQTPRYQSLCVALLPALLMGLYILTTRQDRYRQSLRTRSRERERVARELHDTLLQGIQAVLFRLQDWEADPVLPDVLRAEVAAVVSQARAVVVEGRERILNLRGAEFVPTDLIGSLSAIGENEAAVTDTAFQLHVHGKRRSLTRHAKRQLFDIGREAIRNAYAHARAKSITVIVEYGWRTLRIEIRDNGRGIDPVASDQQEKHFGLLGMRERAAELYGALSITRLSQGGTAVSVVVPAGAAYKRGFRVTC
jgi:signal transduction histidine kinase